MLAGLGDVFEDDPESADWSIGQLRAQSQIHRLVIYLMASMPPSRDTRP